MNFHKANTQMKTEFSQNPRSLLLTLPSHYILVKVNITLISTTTDDSYPFFLTSSLEYNCFTMVC